VIGCGDGTGVTRSFALPIGAGGMPGSVCEHLDQTWGHLLWAAPGRSLHRSAMALATGAEQRGDTGEKTPLEKSFTLSHSHHGGVRSTSNRTYRVLQKADPK
jgi:hypothetical protein